MAVFAPYLSFFWENASGFGLDAAELFREAGIDPALRLDINARVSAEQLDMLVWRARQKCHDDAFVFHLAEHIHPSYLGVMGYAWLTSASLRKAFARLVRYQKLLADDAFVSLEDHGNTLHVLFHGFESDIDPDLRERLRVANAVKLCRLNVGDSFKPTRVCFRQAEPARPGPFYEYFRCELEFACDSTRLVIDATVADQRLAGFNAQLEDLLEHQIIEYLARLDDQDIVCKTQSAIVEQMPSGHVSIEDIATRLNMSARTLRRKLKDSGKSFKDLLADTRRELGERYIRDSKLSLTEVAFMLGFSDSSSFSRAFKNWEGTSPSEFRASQGAS